MNVSNCHFIRIKSTSSKTNNFGLSNFVANPSGFSNKGGIDLISTTKFIILKSFNRIGNTVFDWSYMDVWRGDAMLTNERLNDSMHG